MWKPRTVPHVRYCAASGRAGGRPTLTRFPTDFYLPLEDMRDGGRQHVRRWRYSRPGRAALILAAAACEAQSFLLAPQGSGAVRSTACATCERGALACEWGDHRNVLRMT